MLTIRPEQIHQFLQQDEPAFVEALLTRVRQSHPTWRQTDDMLRDSIRVGIKRARQNGLSSDRHIGEFVLIMFAIAPNFDRQQDIRRMLDDIRLPIAERWERLFTPEFDAAWDEADHPGFLDTDAWFEEPPKDLSEIELPTLEEWAEWLVAIRIERQTPPDQTPREPTQQEIQDAMQELEARVQTMRAEAGDETISAEKITKKNKTVPEQKFSPVSNHKMELKFEKCGDPISENDIKTFETQIGKTLPEDYRNFLLKYNGGYPVPNYWCFNAVWHGDFDYMNSRGHQVEVIALYTLDSGHRNFIPALLSDLDEYIPPNSIPIGDSSSPVFLLMLDGPRRGQVLLWETDTWGDHDQTNPDNLGFIAASFTEFLDGLFYVKP